MRLLKPTISVLTCSSSKAAASANCESAYWRGAAKQALMGFARTPQAVFSFALKDGEI